MLDKYIGMVFGWPEAGLKCLSPIEMVQVAQGIDHHAGVHLFSKVNLALQTGGLHNKDLQNYLAQVLMPAEILEKYKRVISNDPRVIGFIHPGIVRKVLKLLMHFAPLEGGSTTLEGEAQASLCRVIVSLAASSDNAWLEAYDRTDDARLAIALSFEQSAFFNDSSPRILEIKDYLLSTLIENEEVMQAYAKACPVEPWAVVACHLAFTTFFAQGTPRYFQQFNLLALDPRRVLGAGGLPKATGDWFLGKYAQAINADFGVDPQTVDEVWLRDLAFLVERPYVELAENSIGCLDFQFGQSLLCRGLFKEFHLALQCDMTGLYARLGHAFEDYVSHLLREAEYLAKTGCRVVGPLCGNVELDGAIQSREVTALLECKTGVVGTSIKLKCDVEELKGQLRGKFIDGATDPKGFRQLQDRTRRFLENPSQYGLRKTPFVIPTLIVEDDFVAQRMVLEWCALEAAPLFAEFGDRVPFLAILHAADLGSLAAFSRVISVPDAIYRMRQKSMGGLLTTSQWIDTEFRSNAALAEQELVLSDRLGFLDRAMQHYEAELIEAPARLCPECGSRMDLSVGGQSFWVCLDCPEGDALTLTEEEANAQSAYVATVMERYSASGLGAPL